MFLKASRLCAVFCLVLLVLQVTAAQNIGVVRRQDDRPETTSRGKLETEVTSVNRDDKKPAQTSTTEPKGSEAPVTITRSSSTLREPTKTGTPAISATGEAIDNAPFLNVTIPEGQLPLRPEITPGWGVAGIILLLTGTAYTLIGVKNRWVHTFFSTAYAAALGIAVLIIYVMNYPVSNGAQGGYVAAVVVAGCVVGAASTFFKEITEGLGCALGGFCVSMWLLCLVPGGLLKAVAARAIFISGFTVGGFVFYFSRWTRDWALMTMISFAGATAMVLGIDAFSRAGLKEFWAYIWNLNENLFPLGADTYPVTKGIRVETAIIVIFFIAGVISQVKLWRIVREQKKKRAAERAEAQRNLELEEENIGRQLEEDNARERRQWERVYGNGEIGSSTASRDSYVGDSMSEKKGRTSQQGSTKQITSVEIVENEKMNGLTHKRSGSNPSVLTAQEADGKFRVRVAADDVVPPSPNGNEEFDESLEQPGPMTRDLTGVTVTNNWIEPQAGVTSRSPKVVPLPFKVPTEAEAQSVSNRSSVATFADEDEAHDGQPNAGRMSKRFSQGSKSLLRRLSNHSRRTTQEFVTDDNGDADILIVPRQRDNDGDNGSIAATIDGESISCEDDDMRSVISKGEPHARDDAAVKDNEDSANTSTNKKESPTTGDAVSPEDAALGTQSSPAGLPESSEQKDEQAKDSGGKEPENSEKTKSIKSEVSAPMSLTKDRLPRPMSRVALSYRTNEWAKHLSHAETPEMDELQMLDAPVEEPAPIDIDDLTRTALDGAPAPVSALNRYNSQMAGFSDPNQGLSRQGTLRQPPSPPRVSLDGQSQGPGSPVLNQFRSSSNPLRSPTFFQPIAEEQAHGLAINQDTALESADNRYSMSSPYLPLGDGAQRVSSVPGVVSYSNPQTLIGQREMFLRTKSQGNLLTTMQDSGNDIQRPPSEVGSLSNYPIYAAALATDPDDLPLNQRKQFMRQSSMMTLSSPPVVAQGPNGIEVSENSNFNSHQPKRASQAPSSAARQVQMASFRQSIAQDLRSGTPMMSSSGRGTPFASATNLLSSRDAEVQRGIEMQRNMILSQKEADAQRKEMQQREKDWADRVFDERMRSGDFLEAHREVMRKMQRKAKDQG